jgi:hypothetical protein
MLVMRFQSTTQEGFYGLQLQALLFPNTSAETTLQLLKTKTSPVYRCLIDDPLLQITSENIYHEGLNL